MTNFKRFLTLFLIATLAAFSVQVWGALTEAYSYTFTAKQFEDNTTAKTLGTVTWTPVTSWSVGTGYWGYDGTKGQQWGSGSHTLNSMTITSGTSFTNVKKITVNGSIASSGGCTLSVKVGGTAIGTSQSLTTTATAYDFESSGGLTGTVSITLSNGSKKKAQYIKSITIYTESGGGCDKKVTVSKGSESHGTFSLDKTGEQETCSGLTVTVTDITPASGYKFDHIEQSGVAAGNVTINNAAKTVTYASNTTGTSAITAVFVEAVSETFDLVTDVDDLEDGAEVVILNSGVTQAMAAQNTNNRAASNAFTANGAKTQVTVEEGSAVRKFTLGTATGGYWTLYDAEEGGYLYAASSSSNHLKTQETNDANGEWTISFASGGDATVTAHGSYSHNLMQYNTGSTIFSCYTSGQTAVKIFQKPTGPTISVTSALTTFSYNLNEGPSASQTFTVKGKNLTGNLTVTAPTNYQVSLDGSSWANTQTLTATAGTVSSTTVYVRLIAGLAVNTYNGDITISGGGATSKNVTVNGEVVIECTTPTLSFEGSVTSVNKVLGSGKFTIAATALGNTLGAAITYSSSNTTKAEVDENTGEVTLKQATGSGSPVTITATLAAINTGVACQNEVTTSYTLTIYNKVTWLVNDEEYTTGTPTTEVLQGGQITQLPSNPNGDTYCGGKEFIGWTDHEVADPAAVAPSPLYKKASDMSSVYITENKTLYAVFATSSGAGTGGSYPVDFESTAGTYTDWTFTNLNSRQTNAGVTAHGGSYFGNTAGTATASLTTVNKIESPTSISFYVSKQTTNTTASSWKVQTSSNGTNWSDVGDSESASSMDKGEWVNISRDLSSKSNVYVRIYYDGTTAVRCIDDVVLSYGEAVTYSDYSTVCGTCLPAPTILTVTPKSNRATITWTAVPDATGYTVTCTGGIVSVVGTTATITGLASETTYNFSIRSQGSDPYTCFPAYNGSFTTTACEDSPVLGSVTVTPTTATIPWTCEAATATIRVYEDAECNTQVGADHTSCTSPYTVESLTSNTTYYYKIWAGGTCASPIGSFKTEEIKLDIAEWKTDAVVISYNGDASLTLTSYTEETHGDPHANVAEDIFFSKYFEAAANVKLLAIFNGTLSTVDLSNYQLGLAQAGEGTGKTQAFAFKKFSEFVKTGGGGLTADELELKSNEELILITYTDVANDEAIIKCAQDDEEHSKFSTYVRISSPELQFNGDDVISLLNPDGDMIDLIGAGTKGGGLDRGGASFIYRSGGVDYNGFMDKPGGWYTTSGYKANTDNTETADYALSTNRCLLIRRKHVKSGHIAVELNTTDFVTLGAHTYMGNPREGEWKGVQIPGSTTEGSKPGLSNSCDGFEVVGSYNYNEYYVDFEINGTPTTFEDLKSDPFDGTYIIPVSGLIDKACTMVRVELRDGSDQLVIRKDVKVPIMIEGDKNTTDDIFHSHYKDADICRECDVVILGSATLTKAANGTSGDIPAVRDLKVYQGGKLIVPSGTTYNINSLAFRRQEDEISTADVKGTLNINETKGVSLDFRVDPANWHYFALPYDCKVSDITYASGEEATLGTDYLIKRYDGAKRAATQSTGCWEMVSPTATLKKGIGYIFAIPGEGIVKREFRFPMANGVIPDDLNDKTAAGVYGYGCNDDDVRANHRGWNLLGNPYLLPYTSDIESPVLAGEIVEDHSEDDPDWNGHYKFNDPVNDLRYIVVPIANGWAGYEQVPLTNYEMKPFTSYFVQIGGTNPSAEQGVEFKQATLRPSPIVARQAAEYEEDTHPVWCAVDLTNS